MYLGVGDAIVHSPNSGHEVEITFSRMPEPAYRDIVRRLEALPAVSRVETAADDG